MSKRRYIIIFFIFIIFIFSTCMEERKILLADTLDSPHQEVSYKFVTKWGRQGKSDGEFDCPPFTYVDKFLVTDKSIEELKGKLDEHLLEEVKKLKNKDFGKDEFVKVIENIAGVDEFTILEAAKVYEVDSMDAYNGPFSMTVDGLDHIYVADLYNYRIQKFDSNGNFITKWGSRGEKDDQFTWLTSIDVDSKGNVYVVDLDSIKKFDSEGNFITKWKGQVDSDRTYQGLGDIAVDPEGYVFVINKCGFRYNNIDRSEAYIQKFDSNGNFIKKWFIRQETYIKKKTHLYDGPNIPDYRMDIDSSGNIFLLRYKFGWYEDSLDKCDLTDYYKLDEMFIKFCIANRLLSEDYMSGKYGIVESQSSFNIKNFPRGEQFKAVDIAIDSQGNIFTLDTDKLTAYDSRSHKPIPTADNCKPYIRVFDSKEMFITSWGSFGSGDGQFNRPEAVTIDSKGDVYVLDTGNYRIQKFAPISNTVN